MGKIIKKNTRGVIVLQAVFHFTEGYKYLIKDPSDQTWQLWSLKVFASNGERAVFTDKSRGTEREFYLNECFQPVVEFVDGETYPLHRFQWRAVANRQLVGKMVDVSLYEQDNGSCIASLVEMAIQHLHDIHQLLQDEVITPYMAVRLAYKLGQAGMGAKIFIKDYK